MSEYYTSTDHFVLLPAIMLALFGCAILLFEFLIGAGPKQRRWLVALGFVGLAFTGRALWMQQAALNTGAQMSAFKGSLAVDGFSLLFNWIFLFTSAIV